MSVRFSKERPWEESNKKIWRREVQKREKTHENPLTLGSLWSIVNLIVVPEQYTFLEIRGKNGRVGTIAREIAGRFHM